MGKLTHDFPDNCSSFLFPLRLKFCAPYLLFIYISLSFSSLPSVLKLVVHNTPPGFGISKLLLAALIEILNFIVIFVFLHSFISTSFNNSFFISSCSSLGLTGFLFTQGHDLLRSQETDTTFVAYLY